MELPARRWRGRGVLRRRAPRWVRRAARDREGPAV